MRQDIVLRNRSLNTREFHMENVKDIAQIIYYIALSIAGPLAVIEYLRSKNRDRLEKEYKTYDD